MQGAMDRVSQYGLTFVTKKTKEVYQPTHGKPYREPTITVNGHRLQVVDVFPNLGSTLSRAVHIGDEVTTRTVTTRTAKNSVAFGRLRRNVWKLNEIRLDTKL